MKIQNKKVLCLYHFASEKTIDQMYARINQHFINSGIFYPWYIWYLQIICMTTFVIYTKTTKKKSSMIWNKITQIKVTMWTMI